MTKQTLLKSQATQWKKDKAELEKNRTGYWDYVQTMIRIIDSGSYLEEFQTQEKFLDSEGWKRTYFQNVRIACEARQRCTTIVADDIPVSHLVEIGKAPEKKQAQIAAEVNAKCEQEGRDPTAKDYRKAVKAAMPDPETNGKAHEPEREPGEDEPEEPTAEEFHKMSLKLRASYVATAERLRRDIDDFKRRCPDKSAYDRFAAASNETILALRAWKLK